MAFTSADLDAVDRAIMALVSGERVTEVRFADGRMVKYADADLGRLQTLRSAIASAVPATVFSPADQVGGVSYATWDRD
ncbi:hypothetical protein EOD42_08935 [Rhodovarius crocodyli]|uniref:Uncharacterized protein n=1 Tax=Rhodovarius crocodyli TaxID=1979269 RepID=A0A437MJY9_9PROT|nr:hypothetical protein [Rhodovarius crocodyli]RVT97905.1 hypothetical protein EOD42_08935 [Rhodovarius crocodyli]